MTRIRPIVLIGVAIVCVGALGQHLTTHADGAASIPAARTADGPVDIGRLTNGSLTGGAAGARTEVAFGPLYIDGRGTATNAVVGNGGWVSLTAGYRARYAGEEPDLALSLERKVGSGEWEATPSEVVRATEGPLTVRTLAWSTDDPSASVEYRLASRPASGAGSRSRSAPMTTP